MSLRKKFFGKRHFIKYGNTSVLSEYKGIRGEITYDTTKNVLVVHDGRTAGGFAMANSSSSGAGAYANAVAYVDTKISELVDGAPDLLNTLNELAAAINDDANFITTIGTNITSNAATAYSNAVSYVDTAIGTANTAMASNAATAYTNAVSYVDTEVATAYSNATSYADTVSGTAYSNATFYADTIAGIAYSNSVIYTDSAIGTANTAMAANAATAYTNAVSYTDTAIGTANTAMAANAATAYSNAVSYTDTAIGTANTAMAANAATAYTNAASYADTVSGTAYYNAIAYAAANSYVNDTFAPKADPTFTGNATFDTSTLFIDGTTNYVGIGNTVPQSKLYVYSSGSENFVTFENANNTSAYIDLVTPDHNSYWGTGTAMGVGDDADVAFGSTSYANLIFMTTNTERMRIDSSGNVGIGNNSPGQLLTVAGTIESTSGGVKFPDGTTQTSAGASTGKAIAMAMIFG